MFVDCDVCGSRYRIHEDRIAGGQASFTCQSCSQQIRIVNQGGSGYVVVQGNGRETPLSAPQQELAPPPPPDVPEEPQSIGSYTESDEEKSEKKKGRFGLRWRMLILFFLVPGIVLAVGTMFLLQRIDLMSSLITGNFLKSTTTMAEEQIAAKAKSVADQLMIYLDNSPKWKGRDLASFAQEMNKDPELRKIAIQPVGKTGYTVVHSVQKGGLPNAIWVHPSPKVIGIEMTILTKKLLGKHFKAYDDKFGVPGRAGSREPMGGYYSWGEPDGRVRQKYMYNYPIKNARWDTNMGISATTYIDEFTQPIVALEKQAKTISDESRMISLIILIASLVTIGLIVVWYSYSLSGRIVGLTNIADKISLGELDVDIDTKSRDEIGDMAEAIVRMKDSIRISIERLRRMRRKR